MTRLLWEHPLVGVALALLLLAIAGEWSTFR
jgi:hypothetical protein